MCGGCQHRGHLHATVHPYTPIHLYTPIHPHAPPYLHPPCIYMFPLYHLFPIYHGDFGASVHPTCLGVFWRGHQYICQAISVSVCASICPSVHNSCTSCSPSLWVTSSLDWMSVDVHYASCCCSFLCSVIIMSQVSTTTAMTTTTPVTIVWSGMSSLSMVTMAPSLMGLPATLGQCDVVLLPPRHSGGVVHLATLSQQQPPSQMPLQAHANYAIGPPKVGFFFRVETPAILYFYMFHVCSGICFLLSAAILTYGGSTIKVSTITTFWSLPMAGICATWKWSLAYTRYAQSGCSLHCFEEREPSATQSAVLQPF